LYQFTEYHQPLNNGAQNRVPAPLYASTLALVSSFLLGAAPCVAGQINVTVSGVVTNGTVVYVALCTTSLDPNTCEKGDRRAATGSSMRFTFDNVPPGRMAVAAYQDIDGSGSIERTKLGLPREPFGFSNDAGRERRPTFEAAAFNVGNGASNVSIRLRTLSQAARAQE
jgi:uncharacterized protein (DUF2141 family)